MKRLRVQFSYNACFRRLVQSVKHQTLTLRVGGSNPLRTTNIQSNNSNKEIQMYNVRQVAERISALTDDDISIDDIIDILTEELGEEFYTQAINDGCVNDDE